MHIHVYIYIYIHIHIHKYIHTYTCIHIYIQRMYKCMHTNAYMYTHIDIYTCKQTNLRGINGMKCTHTCSTKAIAFLLSSALAYSTACSKIGDKASAYVSAVALSVCRAMIWVCKGVRLYVCACFVFVSQQAGLCVCMYVCMYVCMNV